MVVWRQELQVVEIMTAKIQPIPLGSDTFEVLPHAVPGCGGHIMVHHRQGATEILTNATPDSLRHAGMQFILAADMAECLQRRADRKKVGAA